MDPLLAHTPAENREALRKLGATLLGGTIGLIGCIVGFLLMCIVGGAIIQAFTFALGFFVQVMTGGS